MRKQSSFDDEVTLSSAAMHLRKLFSSNFSLPRARYSPLRHATMPSWQQLTRDARKLAYVCCSFSRYGSERATFPAAYQRYGNSLFILLCKLINIQGFSRMTRSQTVAKSISILFSQGPWPDESGVADPLWRRRCSFMYTWVNTHKRGVKLVPLQQRRDAQENSSV